jgi:hypothetical protein
MSVAIARIVPLAVLLFGLQTASSAEVNTLTIAPDARTTARKKRNDRPQPLMDSP